MKKTTPCPACGGTGHIEPRHMDKTPEAKRIMALALHEQGYSLRQICKLVGWKSVRSAAMAVRKTGSADG